MKEEFSHEIDGNGADTDICVYVFHLVIVQRVACLQAAVGVEIDHRTDAEPYPFAFKPIADGHVDAENLMREKRGWLPEG